MGYITNSVGLRLGFSRKHRTWNDVLYIRNGIGLDFIFYKQFINDFVLRLFKKRVFQTKGFYV